VTKSTKRDRDAPRSTAKHTAKDKAAKEHYQREKQRRERHSSAKSDVMAEARREYLALLESDATKGKGGRPKKKVAPVIDVEEPVDDADQD
jgi:polyphosphate kinase 2 (PPK2 family)